MANNVNGGNLYLNWLFINFHGVLDLRVVERLGNY